MFDHVGIRVSDPVAAQAFYDTVLGAIGLERDHGDFGEGCPEFAQWDDFAISAGPPATTGLHIAFSAPSRAAVDAFWQAGVDAGHRSDGEPGERDYLPGYYGAFLLDPDGNSFEAVHHEDTAPAGKVDHIWMRVPHLNAAVDFYEAISEFSGFELHARHPDRAHFRGKGARFTVVEGSPLTQNLHFAFPADSDATVDAFHAAALAAGYTDNGGPGERPQYHPGYYGAFVLDPAGANVELVNHNR